MALRLDAGGAGFAAAFAAVLDAKRDTGADVGVAVAAIVADVRARGDDAVIEYTRRFDRFTLTGETMALDAARIDEAVAASDAGALAALKVRQNGSRISTAARCRPTTATATTPGSNWARAGGRWRRRDFTCPAAPRPIPARC